MKKDNFIARRILRRAERALTDRKAKQGLEADGISVGEWQPVDKETLFAATEQKLRDLRAGPSTELSASDGTKYGL